jgi:hypothetical protein
MVSNEVISSQRLEYFDQMLLASGWLKSGKYWVPPEHYREALAVKMCGHPRTRTPLTLKRCHAVMVQVQWDEALVNGKLAEVLGQIDLS